MDEYMSIAIELAKNGIGFTNPNPIVGAVIVKDGRIIGRGWHERYGEPHAERNALADCKEDPSGADMYVTLEPCCHYGKQPPCTDAVIKAGIKHVYVGSYDPNPLVAGQSMNILRSHGIEVTENIMREECDALNKIFFHYITLKTPYVIMKSAISADGKTAANTGDSKWVTNELSRSDGHLLRKRCAAIMVGINTVLADDPMLTCRCEDPSDPIRIICDSHLRIPLDSNIIKTADKIPTIIAAADGADPEKAEALKKAGADVIATKGNRVDLISLMHELGSRSIDSILVEGGAELHSSMLRNGLVNEAVIYIAPKFIGGDGRSAVGPMDVDTMDKAIPLGEPEVKMLGTDVRIRYNIQK